MLGDTSSGSLQRGMVVSAPGKVILFGEHSVVYRKRALAFCLDLRTELTIKPAKDTIELFLPEIDVEVVWPLPTIKRLWEKLKKDPIKIKQEPRPMSKGEEDIFRSFLGVRQAELAKQDLGLIAFLHLYTNILPKPVPFSISIKSQMPVGAGLGSSAAYAVSLAGALLSVSGQLNPADLCVPEVGDNVNACLKDVCEWALCCEKILHGTPSGIDNAICTYGGAVSFKEGKVHQLNPPPLRIMLVNTRVSRNTKTLVAKVRDKYNRLPTLIEPILNSMDKLAESALVTMNEMKGNSISNLSINNKLSQLQELVDINQCLLSALGVSHSSLDQLVTIAQSHGLHAKLTGAGGGGFGLVLLSPETPQSTIDSCRKAYEAIGFESWITCLGGKGLAFAPFDQDLS